jgi:hypothetical protein
MDVWCHYCTKRSCTNLKQELMRAVIANWKDFISIFLEIIMFLGCISNIIQKFVNLALVKQATF